MYNPDDLSTYLKDVRKTKLLTKEEELDLAKRIQNDPGGIRKNLRYFKISEIIPPGSFFVITKQLFLSHLM